MMKKTRLNYGSYLPLDLIKIILLSLPVKTLLRFRCVCKEWYNSIRNPTFISDHNIAHNNDPINYLIFKNQFGQASFYKGCLYDLNDSVLVSNNSYEELGFHIPPAPHVIEFRGSCNGLICLSVTTSRGSLISTLYLWNPSIKKHKMVVKNHHNKFTNFRYGFGFCKSDSNTDDYKIVRFSINMEANDSQDQCILLDVYTLSTNLWKRIDAVSDINVFFYPESGKMINGALHWVGTKSNNEHAILSFDLQRETIHEISLPKTAPYSKLGVMLKEVCWCLGNSSESLYLLLRYETEFSIWIMKEYSVVESWTMLKTNVTIERELHMLQFFGSEGLMMVASVKGGLLMLNLEDQKWIPMEENNSPGHLYIYQATDYNESLVLLDDDEEKYHFD